MKIESILRDDKFNTMFSILVGIGIVCMIRPVCSGSDCSVTKAPAEKDFDKYVYRMADGKCYEFKTELTKCPPSGAIESFRNPFRSRPSSLCV